MSFDGNPQPARRAYPAKASGRRAASKRISTRTLTTLSVLSLVAAGAVGLAVSPNAQAVDTSGTGIALNADFQNVSSAQGTLSDYSDAKGNSLSADAYWNGSRSGACNGILVQGTYDGGAIDAWKCGVEGADEAAAGQPTQVAAASYLGMQKLARGLQKFANAQDGTNIALGENSALAHLTLGANAAAGETLVMGSSSAGVAVSKGRYYALQVDYAAFCDAPAPRVELWLDGKRVSEAIDICAPQSESVKRATFASDGSLFPSDHAELVQAAGDKSETYKNRSVSVVRITSQVVVSGTDAMRVEIRNANTGAEGNEGALDNVKLVDVTPSIDAAFVAPEAEAGANTDIKYTITNGTGNAAKKDWKVAHTLPEGLVVADPHGAVVECFDTAKSLTTSSAGIKVTAAAGGREITLAGDLTEGTASCTISVKIVAANAGSYSLSADALVGTLRNTLKASTLDVTAKAASAKTPTPSASDAEAAATPAPTSSTSESPAAGASAATQPAATTTTPAAKPTPDPTADPNKTPAAEPTSTSAAPIATATASPAPEASESAPLIGKPTDTDISAAPVRAGSASTAAMVQGADGASVTLVPPADATDVSTDKRVYTDKATGVRFSVNAESGSITSIPPSGFTGTVPVVKYLAKTTSGVDFAGTATFPSGTGPALQSYSLAATANVDRSKVFPAPVGIETNSMYLMSADGAPVKSLTLTGMATYTVNGDGSVTATRASGFTGVLSSVQYQAQGAGGTALSGVATFDSLNARELAPAVGTGNPAVLTPSSSIDPLSVKLVAPSGATGIREDGKGYTSDDGVVYTVDPKSGVITARPAVTRMGPVPLAQYVASISGGGNVKSTVYFPLRDYNLTSAAVPAGEDAISPAPAGLVPDSVRVIDPNTGLAVTAFDDIANRVGYSVDSATGHVTARPLNNRVFTIPSVSYFGTTGDGTRVTGTVRFQVAGTETIAPEVRAGGNSVAPTPEGIVSGTLRLIDPNTRRQVRNYLDSDTGIVYYVAPDGSGQIYTQVPSGYRGLTPSIQYAAFTSFFDVFQGVAKFPTRNVDTVAPAAPLGDASTAPAPKLAITNTLKFVVPTGAVEVSADSRSFTSSDAVRYVINPDGSFTATPPGGYSAIIPAAQFVGQSEYNSDFSGYARFPAMGVNLQGNAVSRGHVAQTTLANFNHVNPVSVRIKDPVTGAVGLGPYTSKDGTVSYVVDEAKGLVTASAIDSQFAGIKPAIEYLASTLDGTQLSGLVRFPRNDYDVYAPTVDGANPSTTPLPAGVVPESIKIYKGEGGFIDDANFAKNTIISGYAYLVNANGTITLTPPQGNAAARPRNPYVGYTADGTRVLGWANYPIFRQRMVAKQVPMGKVATTAPAVNIDHDSMKFIPPADASNVAPDSRSFVDSTTLIKYEMLANGSYRATPPPNYVGAVPSVVAQGRRSSDGVILHLISQFPNDDLKIHTRQNGPYTPATTVPILGIDLQEFKFVIPAGATGVNEARTQYSVKGTSGDLITYNLNPDSTVTVTPPRSNLGPVPPAKFETVTTGGVQRVTGTVIFDLTDAFIYGPHTGPGAVSTAPGLTGINPASVKLVVPAGAEEIAADQRSFVDTITSIKYEVRADGSISAIPPVNYQDAIPAVAFTARAAGDADAAQVSGMAMFNASGIDIYGAFADLGKPATAPAPSRTVPTSVTFDVDAQAGGNLSEDKRTYVSKDGVRYVLDDQGQVTATPPAGHQGIIEPIKFRGQQLGLSDNPNYWSDVTGTFIFRMDNYNLVSKPSAQGAPTLPVTHPLISNPKGCTGESDVAGSTCLIDPTTAALTAEYVDQTTKIKYSVNDSGEVVATPPTGWMGLIPPARYRSVMENGLSSVFGSVVFGMSGLDVTASPVLAGVPSSIPAMDGVDPASIQFLDATGKPLSKSYTDPETGVIYEVQENGTVIATQPTNYKGLIPALKYTARSDAGAIIEGTLYFPRGDLELLAEPASIGQPATSPVPQAAECLDADGAVTNATVCSEEGKGAFALVDPLTQSLALTYTDSETRVVYTVNADNSVTATPPTGYQGAIPAAQFAMVSADNTINFGVARFPVKGLLTVAPGGDVGQAQTAPKLDGIDPATMEFILPADAQQVTPDRRHFLSADGTVQYDLLDSGAVTATPRNGFMGPIPGANWQARAEDETPLYGEARFPFANQVQACVARGKGVQGTIDIMANDAFKDLAIQPTTTVLIDPATSRPTTARTVTSVDGKVTYSLNNSGFISASSSAADVDIKPVSFMVFDDKKSPYSGVVDFVSNAECGLHYRVYENRTVVGATDTTTLVAWNLAANSTYSLYLMSEPVLVKTFKTDASGAARVEAVVPAGTAPGLHHWVVRDAKGALVGSLPVQLLGQEGVASGALPDGVTVPGTVPVQNESPTQVPQSPLAGGTIVVGQPTYRQVPGQIVQGEFRPRAIQTGVPAVLAATGVDASTGLLMGGLALLFGAGLVVVSRRQRRESGSD